MNLNFYSFWQPRKPEDASQDTAAQSNSDIGAQVSQKPTTSDEQPIFDPSANDTDAEVPFSVPDHTAAPATEKIEFDTDTSSDPPVEDAEKSATRASDLVNIPEPSPGTADHPPPSASKVDLSVTRTAVDQQQQSDDGRSRSERYNAWRELTRQHGIMVTKRVSADELRRRAREKRRDFAEMFKTSELVPQGNISTRSSTNQQAERPWLTAFAELEDLDEQIEHFEDELVRAEAAVDSMLPKLIGPEPDDTFDSLEEEGIHLQVESRESSSSDRGDPDAGVDRPPEQRRLLEKLDEHDFIMDQLLVLRSDKELLQGRDDSELTSRERLFIENYESSERQLKTQLHDTRAEMDDLRNAVQQRLSLEDDRQSPSEGDSAPLSVRGARSEVIHLWLEGSQPFSVVPDTP